MEFKNYKEKQKFYKELSKQEKMVFISSAPKVPKLGLGMEKGRTYVKNEEDNKNDKERNISKNKES